MRARSLPIALGLLALASPGAIADDAGPPSTEIHMTQQATRQMAPDRLRAELRVEAAGADARQLQADINQHMQGALDKAKAHTEITAETGAYSVNRDFSSKDKARWQASQSLILTARDFAALLDLVGDLQGDGMLVSQMEFFLARETLAAAQSALTASALDALRTRADEVAGRSPLMVDHVEDITVGNATANANPVPMMRMRASAAAVLPRPPWRRPATRRYRSTVSADVVLVPGKR